MHIVGESSRAGLQNNLKRSSHRGADAIQKRSPSPAPAPAVVAPASAPTPPPTRRRQHEPEHIQVRAEDFDKRALQHQADAAKREQILGPYWARDMDEVMDIKRDLLRTKSDPSNDQEQIRLQRRQTAAQERCYVGNDELSCFPTANTTIVQNSWSRFIWNANYPLFAQRGYVDVYLFQEDTDRMVTSWMSQDNGQNRLSFEPTDLWWANRVAADNIQPDQNISWPFYFVVLPEGQALTGTTSRLSTFTALQTTLPFTIAEARASSSSAAAAASASAASASAQSASQGASTITNTLTGSAAAAASVSAIQSSLSAALESSLRASGLSGTETLQGTTTATLPNGSVITATATAQANGGRLGAGSNGNSNGLALPTYAIVLISVLGFLAILAAMAAAYFIMAALRRKRQRQYGNGSYRSSSPMMAAAAGSMAGQGTTDHGYAGETTQMLETEDGGAASLGPPAAIGGAAMMAGHSAASRQSDEQPFTSDEASRMADAFRNALRRPEFAGGMTGDSSGAEGESPNEMPGGSRASALLREELASEGKDLRSVGDRKKPTLHDE
ncbi:hypothetical protein PSEUBRA_000878 [Kalmanozyma brasiliensis GHG001]|uniref:uncharacterized protein n=1 Tax=Kalmanozyma brasiliensis (strain GHG001) TaxID=1365824 RepID=UPI001CE84921|nr:uncharacterized protein PSEUBRA_000878 [Kalmanozyma brasiliensis GHG001]EST09290.2 hypothetical protein PSEUBRA_000878 [Kalmanozyma brasiliensis GHG001]